MTPRPHPRLTRALEATCLLAVLAALFVLRPSKIDRPPEQVTTASPTSTSVPHYAGPTTDTHAVLAAGVARAQLVAFYEWAADQPVPTVPALPAPRNASTAPGTAWTGDVDAAIARHFGDILGQARAVARCESGFDATAVSSDGRNFGVMQINIVHRADFEAFTGRSWFDAIFDPDANLAYARKLYDGLGWQPWACRWAAHV